MLGLTPPQIASESQLEAALYATGRSMPGAEIAYAENNTGTPTTVTVSAAAAASLPGVTLTVPANTRPVEVNYAACFAVGTSGGGALTLSLWDVTAGGVGTEIDRVLVGTVVSQITLYSGYQTIRGSRRLAASASDRILQVKTLMFRDAASALTASVGNGGAGLNPSTISAIQR